MLALGIGLNIKAYKGHCNHVDVKLGVRQGCRAAPFLWASSMSRLMSKLAKLTSSDWILRVLTLYAYDFLLQCEVHGEQDLWDHLHLLGILFDLLEHAGLTMNLSKTVAFSTSRTETLKNPVQSSGRI